MWSWSLAVSAGVGVVALVAALLMWTLAGRFCPPLVLFLTITGCAGIYSTVVGTWVRSGTGWITDNTVGWGSVTGITIVGLAALALSIYVIVRTVQWVGGRAARLAALAGAEKSGADEDEGDDKFGRVIIASSFLPAIVTSIPGPTGVIITLILGGPVTGLAWLINTGFGWH